MSFQTSSILTPGSPLLCLLPVLASTASVTFALTEYWTFLPFLSTSKKHFIPPQSLSAYWKFYLYTSMPGWVGFGILSVATGCLGWWTTTGVTKSLYGLGTVLALGHYTFGPLIAKIIKRIVYGPPENAKVELWTWLKMHTVRLMLMDIPAMVCFVRGFLHFIHDDAKVQQW